MQLDFGHRRTLPPPGRDGDPRALEAAAAAAVDIGQACRYPSKVRGHPGQVDGDRRVLSRRRCGQNPCEVRADWRRRPTSCNAQTDALDAIEQARQRSCISQDQHSAHHG